MKSWIWPLIWPVLLAAWPLYAQQPPASVSAPAPAPAPANASALVPPTLYNSAFTGYQRYREQAPVPWRELNDQVGQTGGHVGIVGGAQGKPESHTEGHKK